MRRGRKRWYADVIDVPEGKSGDVEIRHKHEPAGATLSSVNMRTAMFGQKGERITFVNPTRWHTLSEEGYGVWMTDKPIEQRQTDELIMQAHGRVLVGGLGLGYAVVALSHRPKVREIVVVERNPDIIKLVWSATLQKCAPKMKVSVVEADLFAYLNAHHRLFDWGLFDIWQSDGEWTFHETVVPLRKAAHGIVKELVCWNEDIMRGQLYQGLQHRLLITNLHPNDLAMAHAQKWTVPTLDDFCEDGQSVYEQWAVPFWRWYREVRDTVDDETVTWIMKQYVWAYGHPELGHGLAFLRPTGAWIGKKAV